jgi:hypothetical protein
MTLNIGITLDGTRPGRRDEQLASRGFVAVTTR